jgi:serine/threonine-protein kinase
MLRADSGTGRGSASLPGDLVADASRRLIIFMGVTAGIFLVMSSLALTIWRDTGGPVELAISYAVIVISLGGVLALRRVSAQRSVETIGAGYEIFVVFVLAFMDAWRLPLHDYQIPLDTVSWSCVGIVIFPLLVPMSATKTLVVSLAAAAMHPLAFWLVARSPDFAAPPANVVSSLLVPPFLCAVVAMVPAYVLNRLGRAVKQARQLGAYELTEKLGEGGMGEVWRAKHRFLVRPAAIKLIRPESLGARDTTSRAVLLERFEREAQATAALESPHTVELYDFGVSDDGTLYYVMELLPGIDLESLVARFGPLPAGRVVHLLAQACDSLSEAHERGLVHRDIKPANLLVGRRGRRLDFLRVLDFGLVKREASVEDESLTAEGNITGTPAYLPPEALRGSHPIGPRSDLYSLGCVAYWLLTGKRVFEAETAMKTAFAHATEEPTPPSELSEEPIPADLEVLVLALLAKSPDGRPPSAGELLRSLAACEVEPWSQEAAERWWRAHDPGVARLSDALRLE